METQVEPKAVETKTNYEAMVNEKYPERAGYLRRIHKLWDNAYRVNYHETDGSHEVVESVFVQVVCGQVVGIRN